MMPPSFKLTRDQLAKFLPDERSIRAFENLLAFVPAEAVDNSALIQEASVDAGLSLARAQQALDALADLEAAVLSAASAFDLLALAPLPQPVIVDYGTY